MSSTAVQQPPTALFGQPPSSPPFASPPSPSPIEPHHPLPPMSSPPPQPADDIDMSTSTTLPPAGQRHDRDDNSMDLGLPNGVQPDSASPDQNAQANTVAVEVAPVVVDDDAMDTTPDNSQGLVLAGGNADPPLEAAADTPPPPPPTSNGVNQDEPGGIPEPQLEPPAHVPPPDNDAPPPEPPAPADPAIEPPPPPPPVEVVHSDTDSSDDDGSQPWHPIVEDTSAPDEAELKEIESTPETSALDHEHWENKAFAPLDDPEYTPGESGRIEWLIEHYNGTREKPNRDLVMKSEPATIGGHEWQIKFYPKGNDSDFLSVYVECLSVAKKADKKEGPDQNNQPSQVSAQTSQESPQEPLQEPDPSLTSTADTKPPEWQHAPLPLLDDKKIPKRKSVAAQVSVVLYNPTEPRVHYSRTCLHRFCTSSPDWGWTRFAGPHFEIPHRMRGQRQALLRDDKLAFTCYVRIINDETNCLWEHPSSDNFWDSFAMTGLQALVVQDNSGSPDGNIVSAVASWLLFKPFRQFLYHFKVPDPEEDLFAQPKPLISALQKTLYLLRTQVEPGAGAVNLDNVLEALEWYGISDPLHKLDVIQVWETLRTVLEGELRDTPFANVLEDLCGPKRDYTKGTPSYRVPVVGAGSMQEAVNRSTDLTVAGSPLPQLLTVELDRQAFDTSSRSYVKLMNKITLDDHINVRGTPYTLYSFIVHKQTLQSYLYQPIIRPEGPGSKWYSYSDSREGNKVTCLTHRQAVTQHEGTAGSGQVTGNDSVAYIALYVRDDVAPSAFASDAVSEQWEVPGWISRYLAKPKTATPPPPSLSQDSSDRAPQAKSEETIAADPEPVEERQFHTIDSSAFMQHEGPGFYDAFDPKWRPDATKLSSLLTLKATDSCEEIRSKIAIALKDVKEIKDERQIKFWFLDAPRGSIGRPALQSVGKMEFSSGSYNRFTEQVKDWKIGDVPDAWKSRRMWVHIIGFADLPELPKEPETAMEVMMQESNQAEQPPANETPAPEAPMNEDVSAPVPVPVSMEVPPPELALHPEDTPMSEPDEPEPVDMPPAPPVNPTEGNDTAMVEVDAPSLPDPPTVDVIVSSGAGDTEMGGTQEDVAQPPPPPPEVPSDVPPPPMEERPQTPPAPPVEAPRPRTPEPPPDEIYFFIKMFDAEKQTLEPKGSFIISKSTRLDTTIQNLLSLSSETKLDLWEEEDTAQVRVLRRHKSFAQNDIHNGALLVASLPRSDAQRESLAARAAFADLAAYLQFRAQARVFPARMNGHFTFNYFSAQSYKGVYANGHRHGHGARIYHSGATYAGSFQLGSRHGHGLYTFQNGDTYDGEWVANQQHGTGTFVEAATGNTYTGGWRNDRKFGEGVTHWKSAQETERLCRICWEEEAEAAFYDCGHVVACLECARRVESCPVCRKRVLSAMKLYYVA